VQRVLALRTQIKTPKRETSKSYKVAMDWEKFQEGYFKYLAGNHNEAYETWYDLLKAYPQTDIKLRTKFWMGRAAQKTDHPRQAETLYKEIIKEAPYAYYALLASWFGGIDLLRMISTDVPIVTNRPEKVAPEDLVRVKRAEEFIANGLPSLARLELKEINISETMPNEFLVYLTYLNHQARAHLSVTKIYYELTARGYEGLFSLFGERVMFPTTYYDLVKKHAKYFDLDPIIALSIIKQESAFEPDIVSFANAYGLMQIIKPTAKEMDPKVTVPDLLKPDKNINLGVKYISLMAKRFEGNLIHAFAAYNAGPHNADRWKKTISPSLPPEEYIELITYKETRGYVQNVLRNRYWYSRLINKEVISNLSDLVQLKR
jgi:soluble lytic murein transglycosylase